jgi:phosphoadenosine phosphosulfate reductase
MPSSNQDFAATLTNLQSHLRHYRAEHRSIFATSSFQSNSVVLLHLLSIADNTIPVYFLNTGYHFPETLAFRDALAARFDLNIIDLYSHVPRAQQRDAHGRLLFTSDPDRCCDLNKVQPLEPVLIANDVWINGIRASQSLTRAARQVEEPTRHNVLRYHPILTWTAAMVRDYIELHDLPRHPLEARGYGSVGCQPCTRKLDPGALYDDRTGRWFGMKKTECGIHLDTDPKEGER